MVRWVWLVPHTFSGSVADFLLVGLVYFEKQVWSVNPPDCGNGSIAERLMASQSVVALDLGSDLPPAFIGSISTRDLTPLPIVTLRACCAQTLSSITATP